MMEFSLKTLFLYPHFWLFSVLLSAFTGHAVRYAHSKTYNNHRKELKNTDK